MPPFIYQFLHEVFVFQIFAIMNKAFIFLCRYTICFFCILAKYRITVSQGNFMLSCKGQSLFQRSASILYLKLVVEGSNFSLSLQKLVIISILYYNVVIMCYLIITAHFIWHLYKSNKQLFTYLLVIYIYTFMR